MIVLLGVIGIFAVLVVFFGVAFEIIEYRWPEK
jgi:hypothetical protein